MRVTHRFGEAAGFPWDREERGDIVRYRMRSPWRCLLTTARSQPGA